MIELKAVGPSELPRFHKDFIGIGHELQRKRRDRRKVALEERSIVNRVLYLEKQEVRTRKTLGKKQQLVSKLVETADRQHNEMQSKQQLRLEREEELERLKNENRFRRILHLEAKQHTIEHIQTSKMQDYSRIKKIEELGELSKINFKLRDLDEKRRKAMTIMEGHNKGRSKVDQYFKKQNKQHASAYKERISLEENTVNAKMSTIKQLQRIETVLRQRVEQGSAKVSQVDQLLLDVSRSIDRQRSSRVSIAKSHRQSAPFRSRSQLETMENQLIAENAQAVTERKREEEVEEDIQSEEEEDGVGGKAFVRKRNRNKHKNRYRQYELF